MASLNKVYLLGNLGGDPDLRSTQNGKAVCSFSLATNERIPDGAGGWKDKAEWHKCVAWDKTAEAIHKHLRKGSSCLIEGRLQTRDYEKDGQKRYVTEIVVWNVQFLGGKREDEGTAARTDEKPASNYAASPDDEIPF